MMREQLCQYVNLLFAGTAGTEEIRQEILQNTLDRFDDLIDQGKTPEAAYQLAIIGIGDLGELLGTSAVEQTPVPAPVGRKKTAKSTALAALGTAMFVLCPIPVLVFQNEVGVALLLTIVAVGVMLCIIAGADKDRREERKAERLRSPFRKSICSMINVIMLVVYFAVSFKTMAWHITWLVFPIAGAVEGLIMACLDLMGVE